MAAVLGVAVDWPTGPDGYAVTTVEDFIRETAAWSDLGESQVRAALARLLLHQGNAADHRDHAYTEVERRTRLTTHPLIAHQDGRILILPWLVHAAQQVYQTAFDDGRLPHAELPKKVRDALTVHRQVLEKQLEADIAAVASRLGMPHFGNLKEKDANRFGLPTDSGEIDLLIADPAAERLWVVEAKHPHPGHSPHALQQHIDRFTKTKTGYLLRLRRKANTVAAHPDAAAAACGAPPRHSWRVVPLIVTHLVEPTAFIADPQATFTITAYLSDLLAAPHDPPPGWWQPSSPQKAYNQLANQ
ncbi:hypothetical protein [Streptomyces sp. NPDC052107]|uniref:hypothetical protein n=1 Tax=Streptomyces sp. NPDC052107 TaxID=3155632 RepID=UPI00342D3605